MQGYFTIFLPFENRKLNAFKVTRVFIATIFYLSLTQVSLSSTHNKREKRKAFKLWEYVKLIMFDSGSNNLK